MRSRGLRWVVLGGIVIAAVVAASPAGAVRHAVAARHKSITLKFPVPAASSSPVVQLSKMTITVKAPKGKKLGRATLKMMKPKDLDSNVRAVAVLESPRKASRKETFTILASITRFPSAVRRHASAPATATAGDGYVFISWVPHWPDPNDKGDTYLGSGIKDWSGNCKGLAVLNTGFEGKTSYITGNAVYELHTVLPSGAPTYQSSNPEEIVDDQVAQMWGPAKCAGTPEAFDSGGD